MYFVRQLACANAILPEMLLTLLYAHLISSSGECEFVYTKSSDTAFDCAFTSSLINAPTEKTQPSQIFVRATLEIAQQHR